MTLTVLKNQALDDDFVDIKYRELTPAINQIMQICKQDSSVLLCEKDGLTYNIDLQDVLYIEWVDNKSCVYTCDDIFILPSSLVALENSLQQLQFIRISKMCLCNLFKIKSVSNGLNMRLTAEMINGEKIIVSRHYRDGLLSAIHKLAKEIS